MNGNVSPLHVFHSSHSNEPLLRLKVSTVWNNTLYPWAHAVNHWQQSRQGTSQRDKSAVTLCRCIFWLPWRIRLKRVGDTLSSEKSKLNLLQNIITEKSIRRASGETDWPDLNLITVRRQGGCVCLWIDVGAEGERQQSETMWHFLTAFNQCE